MPKTTKEKLKTISRWLARHYDKDAEEAMFALEREIDDLRAQLSKWDISLAKATNPNTFGKGYPYDD